MAAASNGAAFYPPVFYYYPSPPVSPSSTYYSHQYQAQPSSGQGIGRQSEMSSVARVVNYEDERILENDTDYKDSALIPLK